MTRAPGLGGKELGAAIASTKDFKGVTGSITINSHRDADKLAVIQKIQGGKFSYFTSVEPPK